MKEARLILPLGQFPHQSTITSLIEIFGGVTISKGRGFWKPKDNPILEEYVEIVDVAYEPSDENDAKLYDIAWQFGKDAKQVEVYLRYGNGHVQMVTEKSCMDNGHGHFDLEFGGILNAITTLTDPGMSLEDRVYAFEYLQGSTVNKKDAT